MDLQGEHPDQRVLAQDRRDVPEHALIERVRVLGRVAELDGGPVVTEQHQELEDIEQSQQKGERCEEKQVHEDAQNVQRLEQVLGCELLKRGYSGKTCPGFGAGF